MNLKVLWIAVSLACGIACAQTETVLVEAERFSNKGGWTIDTQFSYQMGSPFLLAHGLGVAVADASTDITLTSGDWKVWVRTRDWVASPSYSPGIFKVKVGTNELAVVFGDEASPDEWGWVDGGTVTMDAGSTTLAVMDQSGFDGRVDAIALIKGSTQSPPGDDTLPAWRATTLGFSGDPSLYGSYDVVVLGADVGGCCAAYAAAEKGLSVALVHDRSMLGGNASSEVKQGGANYRRNPDIADFVNIQTRNLSYALTKDAGRMTELLSVGVTILTNHLATGVVLDGDGEISALDCIHVTAGERRRLEADWFVDGTIDGWLGQWSGADMMTERETQDVFNEDRAPAEMLPGSIKNLGSVLYWATSGTTNTVPFPSVPWAVDLVGTNEAVLGDYSVATSGMLDENMVEDGELIRDRLLMAAYGQYSNAKSSGMANPSNHLYYVNFQLGKLESYRIKGDYIVTQTEAENRPWMEDGVAISTRDFIYKVYSDVNYPFLAYNETLSGYYLYDFTIPFRSLYSKDVSNLMMAGPAISVSHLVLSATFDGSFCGECGYAVGQAVALCKKYGVNPRDLYRSKKYTDELRGNLQAVMPGHRYPEEKLPRMVTQQIIVDNADVGAIIKSGTWVTSTSSSNRYGPNYNANQESGQPVNEPDTWFEFQADIPESGVYEVALFYNSGETRSSAVPLVITHGTGVSTNLVNMKTGGSQFTPVTRSYFTNGIAKLRLLTEGQSGYIIADAIRLTKYEDVIVDNADGAPYVQVNGTWVTSTSEPDRFGVNYFHNNKDMSSVNWVKFTPELPQDGFYDIYIFCPGSSDRSVRQCMRVDSVAGSHNEFVDMTQNTGDWNWIGRAEMQTNAGHSVTITSANSWTGYLMADALRFVLATNDVVVDNNDGSPSVTINGSNWTTSVSDSDRYGVNYHHNSRVLTPENWMQFTPDLPVGGVYELHQFWHGGIRATNVKEPVSHADGTTDVYVNMLENGGWWTYVERFNFNAGTSGNVRITSTGATDGHVIADAFWFFYRDENQPTFDWDGDGMPDSFERYYFLDELAALPGDDPDNDGETNLEEYQLGTDPTVTNPSEGSILIVR